MAPPPEDGSVTHAMAAGVDYVDLEFLGRREVIATALLHGPEGVALIDPGPATTIETLERALADRGFAAADVRAILLTHIHLDHAGAAGLLVDRCPHAVVYVHERGAPHLIDPSKLLASASRLYGADMDRLWGEVRAVPAARVLSLAPIPTRSGAAVPSAGPVAPRVLSIVGHEVAYVDTPGHAVHHVSYFLPAARIAFVGDTAGICRPGGRVVLPATPPPDIDLEAWRESTRRILAWHPEQLFLTHFGPQPSPRVHFQDLWTRMEDWSRRVRARLGSPQDDAAQAQAFLEEVMGELTRVVGRVAAEGYMSAGRFDFSWAGLARYLRKKA
jgi:glyoxylase-like metal-dependent hydrolase (beta-lactamase superfamily II)